MTKEAQSDINTPPPVLPNYPKQDLKQGYEPLEGDCTLPNLINKLLKKPLSIVYELEMKNDVGKITCLLLLIATMSFSIFGIVVGTISWNVQIWAAPLKIVCGLLFSGLICLPSLYIFTCMGGLDAKFSTVSGMLCALMALSGLLLIGFAPVVWLFSVSSTSTTFLGFLLIVLWVICACFGLSLVFRSGHALGMTNAGHFAVWGLIFLLVTLQMTTTLRPIVGSEEEVFNFKEKKFFLTYWSELVMEEQ
jgi:hypothetical protein